MEESALDKVVDALDRVRELAIQAGGVARSADARAALADEARQIFANLMDLANMQDAEGRYLFSGNRVHSQPFTASAGGVMYNGDDGTRSQRIGDNRTVQEGDPGSDVFLAIRNGNGTFFVEPDAANTGSGVYTAAVVADLTSWVPDDYRIEFTAADQFQVVDGGGVVVTSGTFADGDTLSFNGAAVTIDGQPATGDVFHVRASRNQDIFATVQDFIASLEQPLLTQADHANAQSALNSSLLDLDRALDHMGVVRSRVGARLTIIDDQLSTNADVSLQLSETMAAVRDVDYASAISELESRLFGLEAAQKTFQSSRSFSLFDIL
jgi:flagellar hook-associated protein 3 FlgL